MVVTEIDRQTDNQEEEAGRDKSTDEGDSDGGRQKAEWKLSGTEDGSDRDRQAERQKARQAGVLQWRYKGEQTATDLLIVAGLWLTSLVAGKPSNAGSYPHLRGSEEEN
ncbi:hypothetical protein Pmani_038880 [Petrolisthes manimaculis]|uniref:Uncharacterized protein n=1 Tax=Petrolisthes manimaculis TaxID=1843537 RepID=A0AAE1NES7_9EUCA|nr:hypothetical protein Pmani_038880 [Petrolisthes manimaculis]